MNDPLKIIWKYKNNKRKVQYNIYIFIGNLLEKNLYDILIKFTSLNLYDTLMSINNKELKVLEDFYGDKWYMYFFNIYHINNTFKNIKEDDNLKNNIINKYTNLWYKKNIDKDVIINSNLDYHDYANNLKSNNSKFLKKTRSKNITIEEETDFRFFKKENKGGGKEDEDEEEEEEEEEENKIKDEEIDETEVDDININIKDNDDEIIMENIENLYSQDVVRDDDLLNTSKIIEEILKDNKKNSKVNLITFDTSKNDNIYDEQLENVYEKNYVYQYVFKDDNIKTLRDKICTSILCDDKYGKLYLIPSRQYLWSEYLFNNIKNKVMLGQRWLNNNNILIIDIEPSTNIRVYEELKPPLKSLKENIRKYNSKVRREDDDGNIIYEYTNFMTNNEIYMIDIYNELGEYYNKQNKQIELRNIIDVYLKIYFPKIGSEDIKSIIDLLNHLPNTELSKTSVVYENINNNIILENEITTIVEDVKINGKKYDLYKERYITQSVVHLNLKLSEGKLDLYNIFNDFIVDKDFPFIQYQTPDSNVVYKFNEKEMSKYIENTKNKEIFNKWFDNSNYGISFKTITNDGINTKFINIILNETGRIEYKTQWREEVMATIEHIKKTYEYAINLIKKLNIEIKRVKFIIPIIEDFSFAFINIIQKFNLPKNSIINHNDLSNFSRFFYPYISLVIEPKKRKSKNNVEDNKSKFGSYFRFKRISKYEDKNKLEQRFIHYERNYEFTEKNLIVEISKQLNMTVKKAQEEYRKFKEKYPKIKKSRRVLKKLENLPKYKPPGIGIDIQGKNPEKYKIRISGARSESQLERILEFVKILLLLYYETYHLKDDKRNSLKDKLKKLIDVAERRFKVDDIVIYNEENIKPIKKLTKGDISRIGFKPEKGQNQWSRSCQNSGSEKKRRPMQFNQNNINKLLKLGYKEKNGKFYKKIKIDGKEVTLSTLKFNNLDKEGNSTGMDIHYACDPKENNEFIYVGYLTRSLNPNGLCMPCCFKKNPLLTKNNSKREYYLRCLEKSEGIVNNSADYVIGNKLYILQNTNKIQPGRFSYLSNYLNYFFNQITKNRVEIKYHYLLKTNGFYLKYGIVKNNLSFLNSVSQCFDIKLDKILNKMKDLLIKDKNDEIYTSLRGGRIKNKYKDKKSFIKNIMSYEVKYKDIYDLICMPGILYKDKINIIIFNRLDNLEDESKLTENFEIIPIDVEDDTCLEDPKRKNIILIKEKTNFYPIFKIIKPKLDSKTVDMEKVFNYIDDKNNIIYRINNFYKESCKGNLINYDNSIIRNSKTTRKILEKYKIKIDGQIIDNGNKCKYLIVYDNYLIPLLPSSSLYDIKIINKISINSYDNIVKKFKEIEKITNKEINLSFNTVFFNNETKDKIEIIAISFTDNIYIPVKNEEKLKKYFNDNNISFIKRPLTNFIDDKIKDYDRNNNTGDIKLNNIIQKTNFIDESYELFRLEISNFLKSNIKIKKKIIEILKSDTQRQFKLEKIKLIIYRIVDFTLFKKYININNYDKKLIEEVTELITNNTDLIFIKNEIDTKDYIVNNNRILCNSCNKKECNLNKHCIYDNKICKFILDTKNAILFSNKISEEISQDKIKSKEILNEDLYYISEIVDFNNFTQRENQTILKNTNNDLKKISEKILGKNSKIKNIKDKKLEVLNIENPLQDYKTFYIQKIISNNISLFRAYTNSYYWLKHQLNNIKDRNLGYFNTIQTNFSNFLRGNVITWLSHKENLKYLENKDFKELDIKNIILNLIEDEYVSDCNLECFILNKIFLYDIYIYNEKNNIIKSFKNGKIFSDKNDKISLEVSKNSINIKLINYIDGKPTEFYVIYYK